MWQKNSGDDETLSAFSVVSPHCPMLFISKRQKFGELIFLTLISHGVIGVILSPDSRTTLINKINHRIQYNSVVNRQ
jgi:hypothetical protein